MHEEFEKPDFLNLIIKEPAGLPAHVFVAHVGTVRPDFGALEAPVLAADAGDVVASVDLFDWEVAVRAGFNVREA